MFEDVRHERSLLLLPALTDPDILQQSKITDNEMNIIKYLALEKLHRRRIVKDHFALQFIETNFRFI